MISQLKANEDIRILVVGDIMLDKYVTGTVDRISPEAPVPVLNVTREYSTLGGSGNVVRNLRSLEIQVSCVGRIGDDEVGEHIVSQLNKNNVTPILLKDPNVKSTQKERIIADHRMTQMMRIDRESKSKLSDEDCDELLTQISNYKFDTIIVSDYDKGLITRKLMDGLKSFDTRIIIDPKPTNMDLYGRSFMITPNDNEFNQIGRQLLANHYNVLQTRGQHGMILHNMLTRDVVEIPSKPVEVYNVSGAGDTVIAIMATCISKGIDLISSAKISNDCARCVVQKPGTSTVNSDEFIDIMDNIINKE